MGDEVPVCLVYPQEEDDEEDEDEYGYGYDEARMRPAKMTAMIHFRPLPPLLTEHESVLLLLLLPPCQSRNRMIPVLSRLGLPGVQVVRLLRVLRSF